MTSHSNILSLTSPQLIPGTPLSLCICFSCRLKSPEAAELAMGRSVYDMGEEREEERRDALGGGWCIVAWLGGGVLLGVVCGGCLL